MRLVRSSPQRMIRQLRMPAGDRYYVRGNDGSEADVRLGKCPFCAHAHTFVRDNSSRANGSAGQLPCTRSASLITSAFHHSSLCAGERPCPGCFSKLGGSRRGAEIKGLAEREGFEPPIPVKVCPLSRRIVSTTHAPLRKRQSSLSIQPVGQG
jgi:hypothetical protein